MKYLILFFALAVPVQAGTLDEMDCKMGKPVGCINMLMEKVARLERRVSELEMRLDFPDEPKPRRKR